MNDHPKALEQSGNVDRRTFLKRAGAAGIGSLFAGGLLSAQTVFAQDATVKADPRAKKGGTLRIGINSAPAHFDVHQSNTVGNIGTQGPMYDLLIRRDPRDGQTIIPDLASRWEISPDGKRYIFYLRRGVKFHDGAEFTAEDVRATYQRIISPPQGVVIPRTPLFSVIGEIVTPDPYRIEFRLKESRPQALMLGAFACGFNIILRKKTLDDNGGNLRQVMAYPGTGAYRHVSRKDKEVWIMERNPDYWNKGLPYLDRLEVYHGLPFSPELSSTLLTGKTDFARILDPVTYRKAKETPGMKAAEFNNSVIQAVCVNAKRPHFSDPRVRRAMHLALDRYALLDVVKDIVVPSALPETFTGIRLAVGMAYSSVVAAELFNGIPGIGGLVKDASNYNNTPVVLVGIFAIGISGLVIDGLLRSVERRAVPWRGRA